MAQLPHQPAARLAAINVYPVKSLRGCTVQAASVDEMGLVNDRRFLVVDAADRFLTQRVLPKMALIDTQLSDRSLTLSATNTAPMEVPLRAEGAVALRPVTIWKSEGLLAEDCGEEVATWLSRFLETPCRLVRIGPAFHRAILKPAAAPGDVVAFADAFPFMGIAESSLADLNQRLSEAGQAEVPMDRFRPSIVFSGCAAFAEDTWGRIQIGSVVLRAGGQCVRCQMVTTNQLTGERGAEPLRTLAKYRRDPSDSSRINFGQNFLQETKSGILTVGTEVHVL